MRSFLQGIAIKAAAQLKPLEPTVPVHIAPVGDYNANLTDALNQPDGAEAQVSSAMLHGVYVGAAGAPFLITGVILARISAFRRRRARRA